MYLQFVKISSENKTNSHEIYFNNFNQIESNRLVKNLNKLERLRIESITTN